MTARAALLAVALATLPAARAQDVAPIASPGLVAPVISSVVVNAAPGRRASLGGVVHLVGEGFLAFKPGAPPPGLVVEVDGQPALLVEGGPEFLGFYVPYDASVLGLVQIQVTRPDGARAETTLHLFTEGFTGCFPNGLVLSGLLVNGRRAHGVAPGDTVELRGRGWPADQADGTHPPGLTVTLADHPLLLVEATPDRLVVRIPEATPIGPSTLEVRVRKGDGLREVEAPLDVVDPTWGAAPPPPRLRPPPPAPAPAPAAPPMQLGVSSCGPVQSAAGARLEVKGTAPHELPDGFTIHVEVRRGGQEVESRQATIRGGVWSASLEAVAQPGRYEVIAVFELSKQGRISARRFASNLPAARRAELERLERRETFVIEGP